MQDFKRIQAWQRSHALAIALHGVARYFGKAGHAHLRSQLTRAADSIATNIVDGCGSASRKEFARYLDIAIKSASETEYHLIAARDLRLVSPTDAQRLTSEVVEIRKMVHGYRKKILKTIDPSP